MKETEESLRACQQKFHLWVQERLGEVDDLRLSEFTAPGASGFSNATLFTTLSYRQHGEAITRRIVIRIAPASRDSYPVFRSYDIPLQYDVMKALGESSDVPVPRMLWKELDTAIFGEVFYVMEHIEGQIPSDNPPYPTEGFVKDASPAQREAMWWSGLEAMARLHRLDWKKAGLGFLAWPDDGRSAIDHYLAKCEQDLEWASAGREQPLLESTLEWLKRNKPVGEPEAISWGDARVGNQIFDDFKVVAIIDWEMVAIGSPEIDLGWWLFVDKVTMAGGGLGDAYVRPRLEGLPSHEESVERYGAMIGRPVRHSLYYQVFAGLRFGIVMLRLMQRLVFDGTLPAEYCPLLERNNAVTQTLAAIRGLPPPE
ncbi:MAG: phosphotransferase family protein [Pseudomonadales bacterium]|jgi:aminoglycoside phosphotransferase (APT) family kinase protein|nr:phosphotransferase family protein [Gammaproteobacteria bacterium]MBP6050918.1 phosphotransferase family protein [Pseudomonadales bacterium]MBK6582425.1 phosphotransferase family protein [Gammaproteobacteria bacterium]MBK7521304.1 phosphotransferase family protein [Gammaproteobacteria bacterium]MBK8306994.1 phosphotransferase family protein [Gammaproteobacteria bacterium]